MTTSPVDRKSVEALAKTKSGQSVADYLRDRAVMAESQHARERLFQAAALADLVPSLLDRAEAAEAALGESISAKRRMELEAENAELRVRAEKAEKEWDETAWLVEFSERVSRAPAYYGDQGEGELGPTTEVRHAIRFARKVDAEAFIRSIGWTDATAVEHMWCPSPPTSKDETE